MQTYLHLNIKKRISVNKFEKHKTQKEQKTTKKLLSLHPRCKCEIHQGLQEMKSNKSPGNDSSTME